MRTIPARDLKVGDLVIEARTSPRVADTLTLHTYRVEEVRHGRFTHYRLNDENGSWRTFDGSVKVEVQD